MIDTFAIRSKLIDLALSGELSFHDVSERVKFKHKVSKKWPEIDEKEKNYTIPENWKYARIGEIATINPKNVLEDSLEVSFVPMACVREGFTNSHTSEIRPWGEIKKGFAHFADGDIGVAKIAPCFQNRKSVIFKNLTNGFGAGTTELTIVRVDEEYAIAEFLLYFFQSATFISKGIESFTGVVGQQRVHKDYLKMSSIPLPPVKEQQRIVKKLNDVFLILDNIDEFQTAYISDLEVLKSKLIDAGIRGKLTERCVEDGTAEVIYEEEISDKDKPFSIPQNWSWIRLGWAMEIERGGSPRPIKAYMTEAENGINWIKIGDVEKNGKYIFSTKEKIKPEGEKRSRKVYPGDFLLTNSMSFGRPYISKIEGCIHDGWLLLRNSKNVFDLNYLYWLLSSKYAYNQFVQKASGATVDNLNKDKVASAIIPLPPIAEQRRIAKRIEELIQLL